MKITREGYTAIVNAYQESKEDKLIEEMIQYLSRSITQITYSSFERVSGYGYVVGDVYSIVLEVLWEVMKEFDGSQGSDFLAYFTQRVRWKINDELIEKKGSLADDHYYNSLSINSSEDLGEEGGVSPNELFKIDDNINQVGVVTYYLDLLHAYSSDPTLHLTTKRARSNDVEILVIMIRSVELGITDDKSINEVLYRKFPELTKDAVLHRKRSAVKRFGKYLKESL